MKPLATALSELLREREMSQAELWALAGLSPTVVSRYLSGERGRKMDWRSADTIERLAGALDVGPDYFIEYRMWQVSQAAKLYPLITNEVYDVLMGYVSREPGGLSSLRSKGK